jgi:hypothetical protein
MATPKNITPLCSGFSVRMRGVAHPVHDKDLPDCESLMEASVEGASVIDDKMFGSFVREDGGSATDCKVVYGRKWIWPVVRELRGVKPVDCLQLDGEKIECNFVFEEVYTWPWYKACWMWLKDAVKGFKISKRRTL